MSFDNPSENRTVWRSCFAQYFASVASACRDPVSRNIGKIRYRRWLEIDLTDFFSERLQNRLHHLRMKCVGGMETAAVDIHFFHSLLEHL